MAPCHTPIHSHTPGDKWEGIKGSARYHGEALKSQVSDVPPVGRAKVCALDVSLFDGMFGSRACAGWWPDIQKWPQPTMVSAPALTGFTVVHGRGGRRERRGSQHLHVFVCVCGWNGKGLQLGYNLLEMTAYFPIFQRFERKQTMRLTVRLRTRTYDRGIFLLKVDWTESVVCHFDPAD